MCVINGKEYYSDTGRCIRKGDIYICSLDKDRPALILQSNKFNNPKQNCYIIAPIKSEHQFESVTKENLQEIVNFRRDADKLRIPIEMKPGDFRFIDMTEMSSVPSSKLLRYYTSIINPELRMKVNHAIKELLVDDDEYLYGTPIPRLAEKEIVSIESKTIEIESKEDAKEKNDEEVKHEPHLQLINTETEIGMKINKAISAQAKSNEQKVLEFYDKVKRKEISKATAAKKLGLTVKAFELLTQQINQGEKSKYANRQLPKTIPVGFSLYVKQYDEGKITVKQIAEKIGKSEQSVYNYIARYRQLQEENKDKVVTL